MSDTDTPLVLIVDDDEAMRGSMAFLFASVGLETKVFSSAAAFLTDLRSDSGVRPGALVLDVRMPEMSGLELQRQLAAMQFPLPIIIVTGHGDVPIAVAALKAGAFDFVEKPFSEQYLLESVAAAIRTSKENIARQIRERSVEERFARLSQREKNVFEGILAGKSNKIIAFELQLSIKSIEVYRAAVMTKMEANSIVELTKLVGIIERANERSLLRAF